MPVRDSLIALDLATVVGFASAVGSQQPKYGSLRMGPRNGTLGECFVAFDVWLHEMLDELDPEVLIFEAPLLVGRGSVLVVQRLMGLAAIAELIGTKRGLRVFQAEQSTVCKAFTGHGRFPGGRKEKKLAVMETCRRYGWAPQDDNQGDALALLHYAQSIRNRNVAVDRAAGPLFGAL